MFSTSNMCHFIGRLTADPEVKYQQGKNGDSFATASFTIACDRALTSQQRQDAKNGNSNIKTADFIRCRAMGGIAEILQKHFHKGDGISIAARYSEWQTTDSQTGEKKYGHSFEVENIGFLPSSSSNNANSSNDSNGNHSNNNSGNNNNFNQNNGSNNNSNKQNQQFVMFNEDSQPF